MKHLDVLRGAPYHNQELVNKLSYCSMLKLHISLTLTSNSRFKGHDFLLRSMTVIISTYDLPQIAKVKIRKNMVKNRLFQ